MGPYQVVGEAQNYSDSWTLVDVPSGSTVWLFCPSPVFQRVISLQQWMVLALDSSSAWALHFFFPTEFTWLHPIEWLSLPLLNSPSFTWGLCSDLCLVS